MSLLFSFSFEIDGTKSVGVIKDTSKATDEYDDAIAEGRSAALGECNIKPFSVLIFAASTNSFKISIGNLAPNKECIISVLKHRFISHLRSARNSK